MNRLKLMKLFVSTSLVLGLVSAIALVTEYAALCDIAQVAAPIMEWRVVGVCMMVTAVFVVLTLITLGLVLTGIRPPNSSLSATAAA